MFRILLTVSFLTVAENVCRIQSYWNNHACCWSKGVGVHMCRLCTLCGANWNGLSRVSMLQPWIRNVLPALVALSLNDGWRVKSFCEERCSGLYIIYDLKKQKCNLPWKWCARCSCHLLRRCLAIDANKPNIPVFLKTEQNCCNF